LFFCFVFNQLFLCWGDLLHTISYLTSPVLYLFYLIMWLIIDHFCFRRTTSNHFTWTKFPMETNKLVIDLPNNIAKVQTIVKQVKSM
jgi:hypothetical protein